ncbi:unnamed protein product [Closterium sp. NIES-64]|nr:unnamed protein product [Closterium sp. NIES-64]
MLGLSQSNSVTVVGGFETATLEPSDRIAVQRKFPRTYGSSLLSLVNVPVDKCPGAKAHAKASVPSGGYKGVFEKNTLEITPEVLSLYKNQGGYDLLGRSVAQMSSTELQAQVKATCTDLKLDGLRRCVLLFTVACSFLTHPPFPPSLLPSLRRPIPPPFGCARAGTGTATTAAYLAEYFAAENAPTKYYYFVRLMGRKASHIALESALQSQANMVILGEQIAASKMTLFDITNKICDAVVQRSVEKGTTLPPPFTLLLISLSPLPFHPLTNKICDAVVQRSVEKGPSLIMPDCVRVAAHAGKHHGVILFPEGLIEHIPEVAALIEEINELINNGVPSESVASRLSPWSAALFAFMPPFIRHEFAEHREVDGYIRFSQIETEKLFAHLVEKEMERRTVGPGCRKRGRGKAGQYKGKKFNAISYFFGYQARGSLPSNFDCDYANALGHTAVHLVAAGAGGYMATVSGLKHDVSRWTLGGVPITAIMSSKPTMKGGATEPSVNANKVDLNSAPVHAQHRTHRSLMPGATLIPPTSTPLPLYRMPLPTHCGQLTAGRRVPESGLESSHLTEGCIWWRQLTAHSSAHPQAAGCWPICTAPGALYANAASWLLDDLYRNRGPSSLRA